MAVTRPPVPSNAPPIGSQWYCQKTGGWPGWWKQTCRLGGLVIVTDYVWLSNQWKVRFNVISNSQILYVGNSETITNFYSFFGTQKVLSATLRYHGNGTCDIRRMQRIIEGHGVIFGKGSNVQPLVIHALSATGEGVSS